MYFLAIQSPVAVSFPYYLAKYIPEPTLYIAPKLNGTPPLPGHLQVAMLDLRDVTTPAVLRPRDFRIGQAKYLFQAVGPNPNGSSRGLE